MWNQGTFKSGTFLWNLGEPEPLRVEPLCATLGNVFRGFGQLPQSTPKLYWKYPKLFKLLGKKYIYKWFSSSGVMWNMHCMALFWTTGPESSGLGTNESERMSNLMLQARCQSVKNKFSMEDLVEGLSFSQVSMAVDWVFKPFF